MYLMNEYKELAKMMKHAKVKKLEVSARGVDWHIDHSLKVIIGISKTLTKSNPDTYRKEFNLTRAFIFASNNIPRGKGKAPKQVITEGEITLEDLETQLQKAKEKSQSLSSLPAKSHFKHPVFGSLDLNMSKRFIQLHTEHHLKIIRDIIK